MNFCGLSLPRSGDVDASAGVSVGGAAVADVERGERLSVAVSRFGDGLSFDRKRDGDVPAGRVGVWTALVCSQHQLARCFGGDVRCVEVE
jgi:hypothetical protein